MKLNEDNETVQAMNGSRNGNGDLPFVHEIRAKKGHGAPQTAKPRLASVLNSEQASLPWNTISRISRGIVPQGDT